MTGMRKLKEEAGVELFLASHYEPKTNFPCKNTLTTPDLKLFIVRGQTRATEMPSIARTTKRFASQFKEVYSVASVQNASRPWSQQTASMTKTRTNRNRRHSF